MTELELRRHYVDTLRGWIGRNEQDGSHKRIVDTYNSMRKLPRNYAVTHKDAWCAATVSAAIEAGRRVMGGKIVALVGQIASGKTTLAQFMEAHGFERIVTYTTRPKRTGEKDGLSYHYLSDNEFTEKAESGFFAEATSYSAKFGHVRYGTSRESLETPDGVNKVIVLNPQGVIALKDAGHDIFVVYLDMSQEVLMRRALKRGDTPAEIGRRITDDTRLFRRLENSGEYVDLTVSPPELLPNQIMEWIQSVI